MELNIKGHTVLIDDEDYELVSKYTWRIHRQGYVMSFVRDKSKKCRYRTIKMHRLIMGTVDIPKPDIDHKNRNPKDNRKDNLRFATRSENNYNRVTGKPRKSLYKGVMIFGIMKRFPINKIIARIIVNKKQIYLGRYDNEKDAAIAYNNAALKFHGEFACLNVI